MPVSAWNISLPYASSRVFPTLRKPPGDRKQHDANYQSTETWGQRREIGRTPGWVVRRRMLAHSQKAESRRPQALQRHADDALYP